MRCGSGAVPDLVDGVNVVVLDGKGADTVCGFVGCVLECY